MHITFFTENYYCGGLDTFLIHLVNHWPYEDDDLSIICNEDHPGVDVIRSKITRPCNIECHGIHLYSNFMKKDKWRYIKGLLSPVMKYVFFIYNVIALRKVLCRRNPDRLMVVNGGYPGGESCRAATICWGMFSNKPTSIHNYHNFITPPRKFFGLIEDKIDSLVTKYTSLFVTVSASCLKSLNNRCALKKVRERIYIYNGVDVGSANFDKKNDIKNELGLKPDSKLCLMLATYEPRKGHDFLLRAFKLVVESEPSTHLMICGYGYPNQIEHVNNYIKRYSLQDSVSLFPFRKNVSDLFESTDLLVVPSQSLESFGLMCIEAMSYSVPVVATNVGGLPEVVKNGEGGYCVSKDDVAEFTNSIIVLLKDDKLRYEQGRKGFERYKKYFTAEKMACKYADIVRSKLCEK